MIKINIEDGNLKVETDRPYNLPEIVDTTLNAVLYFMKKTLELAPATQKEEVKGEIFDLVNYKASSLLEAFAPEYELRPGLTEEAIMKAENELMADEVSKM